MGANGSAGYDRFRAAGKWRCRAALRNVRESQRGCGPAGPSAYRRLDGYRQVFADLHALFDDIEAVTVRQDCVLFHQRHHLQRANTGGCSIVASAHAHNRAALASVTTDVCCLSGVRFSTMSAFGISSSYVPTYPSGSLVRVPAGCGQM